MWQLQPVDIETKEEQVIPHSDFAGSILLQNTLSKEKEVFISLLGVFVCEVVSPLKRSTCYYARLFTYCQAILNAEDVQNNTNAHFASRCISHPTLIETLKKKNGHFGLGHFGCGICKMLELDEVCLLEL